MPVSDLPKYDDLMQPTLKAIRSLGGSASIEEIEARLTSDLSLSDAQFEVAYLKSGALILPDRMSWARSYMKGAGLLANPKRGVWVLTEEGRVAADWEEKKLRRFVTKTVNENYLAKKAEQAASSIPTESYASEIDEEAAWSDYLLQKLLSLDPSAFERLCQRLLRESGFVKVEVTGKSGDGGIDGSGVLRVNLISFQVLFQCKRYAGSVSAGTVRDFRGAMQGRADKGLIITTGTFTADARREATRDGAPAIDLIDGEALCLLLKDQRMGVTVREVVQEEVVIDNAFFESV